MTTLMTHARMFGTAVAVSVTAGVLLAILLVMYSDPSQSRATLLDARQLMDVVALSAVASLPVSLLAGIIGGVLVVRSSSELAARSRRSRARWGWIRGTYVGILVTSAYFLVIGGLHWGVLLLASLGGMAGAAAGAMVGACCFIPGAAQEHGGETRLNNREHP